MKNVIATTAIALLLGLNACKNVDEKLVTEMQQSATVLENSKPAGDSVTINLEQLRTKFAGLPVEKAPAATFVVNKLSQKFDAVMVEYNASKEELKNLQADYEAGKIKKEGVEAKYKMLTNKIDNFEKAFQKISQIAQRPTEDLIQMGQDMAKSEGVDLAKPVSSDMGGQPLSAPQKAAGADAGGASLQGDGSAKKKDGGQ
jgi:hypothetical protein